MAKKKHQMGGLSGSSSASTSASADAATHAASSTNNTAEAGSIDVSVLSKNNEVLAVEAGSDFVDTLARVLQQPLGAVVGCVGGGRGAGDKRALSTLQDSVAGLRDPIFAEGKKCKQKNVVKPMDVAGVLDGAGDDGDRQDAGTESVVSQICPCGNACVLRADTTGDGDLFNVSGGCTSYHRPVAFRSSKEAEDSSFEITWTHIHQANYFVGIMVDNGPSLHGTLGTHVYAKNNGVHFHINSNKVTQMYYLGTYTNGNGVSPNTLQAGQQYSLRYSNTNGQPKIEFGPTNGISWPISIPDNNWFVHSAKYVPVMHLSGNLAFSSVKVKFGTNEEPTAPAPIFHPVARFLISNDLEICESSSLKALEIMQKYDVDKAKDLKVGFLCVSRSTFFLRFGPRCTATHTHIPTSC